VDSRGITVNRITVDEDLKTAFCIRKEVFVEEQGVPLEDEFDEFDTLSGQCKHVLVYYNQTTSRYGKDKNP
jgi:predicted GNAT family N-acyltransferase